MKFVLVILGCLMGTLPIVLGQGLSVALALDQEQFLPGESLVVKVRVSNFTGETLQLGTDESWLSFSVEDARHIGVTKHGTVPVKGEFSLEPSMTATKKVDISSYFDILRAGRYYVSATIVIPQWKQVYQTKPLPFDIINGSSIWEQEFGVPGTASAPGSVPEIRRYALIQTLHSRVIKLYLSLTDSRKERVFRVFPLGQMVSFSNPEPQIDRFSNLHVLYQTSGRTFMHCLINPDGVLMVRETYEYSPSRPVLRAEPDGRITVSGGTRRVMPTDLPPPATNSTPSLDAKAPQP